MRTSMRIASGVVKIKVKKYRNQSKFHARFFGPFCHVPLRIKIINTSENQQQQGLTVSENAFHYRIPID